MRLLIVSTLLTLSIPAHALRNWTCGFELKSVTSGIEWDTSAGSPEVETAIVHSGSASIKFAATGTAETIVHQPNADANNIVFVQFYIYPTTLPDVAMYLFEYADSAGSYLVKVQLEPDGQVVVYNDTTRVAGSTVALTTNAWTRVDIKYDDVTGNVLTVYFDGVQVVTGTSGDVGGGGRIRIGIPASTTATFYVDDIKWNTNAAGGTDTTTPPDGRIVYLFPNGAGDSTVTVDLGGTTPSATVWQSLDENPPNDAVDVATWTANTSLADMALIDSGTAGIPSGATINVAQVGWRYRAITATSCNLISGLKTQANGIISSGTLSATAVVAWNTNDDTANSHGDNQTQYVDAQGGGAYTTALLDSTQLRLWTSDATPDIAVTAAWLIVDYTNPAAAGSRRRPMVVN
jgi:hypothetical protein